MAQSKLSSAVEAIANVSIGAGVAYVSQLLIFPAYDIHISPRTNLAITLWFTFISIVRSYCLRRWFNTKEKP